MDHKTTGPVPRRIDPERLKNSDLKQLAGRLLSLSYRDMRSFAEALTASGLNLSNPDALATAVLDWSDKMGATT